MKDEQLFQRLNELSVKQLEFQQLLIQETPS